MAAPALEALAKHHAGTAGFVFVYTREAHPGEHYPAHASFEGKLRNARHMVARFNIERPMLVDDLEGTTHRSYGLLPNMTYIVAPPGRIVFKADWTDAPTLTPVLDQLTHQREARAAGSRVSPFRVQWEPQRVNERPPLLEGLLVAGPRAVEEFITAAREQGGDAAARPLQEWWDEKRGEKP